MSSQQYTSPLFTLRPRVLPQRAQAAAVGPLVNRPLTAPSGGNVECPFCFQTLGATHYPKRVLQRHTAGSACTGAVRSIATLLRLEPEEYLAARMVVVRDAGGPEVVWTVPPSPCRLGCGQVLTGGQDAALRHEAGPCPHALLRFVARVEVDCLVVTDYPGDGGSPPPFEWPAPTYVCLVTPVGEAGAREYVLDTHGGTVEPTDGVPLRDGKEADHVRACIDVWHKAQARVFVSHSSACRGVTSLHNAEYDRPSAAAFCAGNIVDTAGAACSVSVGERELHALHTLAVLGVPPQELRAAFESALLAGSMEMPRDVARLCGEFLVYAEPNPAEDEGGAGLLAPKRRRRG